MNKGSYNRIGEEAMKRIVVILSSIALLVSLAAATCSERNEAGPRLEEAIESMQTRLEELLACIQTINLMDLPQVAVTITEAQQLLVLLTEAEKVCKSPVDVPACAEAFQNAIAAYFPLASALEILCPRRI